ncbi:hypothetical protein HYPSUDRAFT_816276 [Hypholoma sublateritium FD-334 SS-4]|uniref:Uncharacterized protein n=1 Tax=Hypholoma sublateritium (strain FD-334 SS-4) TaxID=945553 RepID=A0A0D2MAD2_HYPSF|nr:hypothetical protein HYPSUDRAFT_816276 [Hypholoma sublateritium FD-334 SS-4]
MPRLRAACVSPPRPRTARSAFVAISGDHTTVTSPRRAVPQSVYKRAPARRARSECSDERQRRCLGARARACYMRAFSESARLLSGCGRWDACQLSGFGARPPSATCAPSENQHVRPIRSPTCPSKRCRISAVGDPPALANPASVLRACPSRSRACVFCLFRSRWGPRRTVASRVPAARRLISNHS